MRKKGTKVALTVWVEAELRAAVEDYAIANNTFLSEVVASALERFFDNPLYKDAENDRAKD